MKAKFERLLSAHEELSEGEKHALNRRVPTRWNSESDCLEAHIYFRPIVEAITVPTENGLRAYKLTPTQWTLAEDVADVLKVCIHLCFLFHPAHRCVRTVDISETNQTLLTGKSTTH